MPTSVAACRAQVIEGATEHGVRSLGELTPVAGSLKRLSLHMTRLRSLDGVEVLDDGSVA